MSDPQTRRIEMLQALARGEQPNDEALELLLAHAKELDVEARRCAEAEAFKAACVMAVAALEALLLVGMGHLWTKLKLDGLWPARRELLDWNLTDALNVARDAGWFAQEDVLPELDALISNCRIVRNACVHPGAYVRDLGDVTIEQVHFEGLYDKVSALVHLTVRRVTEGNE